MDTANILQNLNSPALSLIVAKRGSGKTTLLKEILENTESWSVYDVNHEYDPASLRGAIVHYFSDLKFLLKRGEPRIIFRPKNSNIQTFEYWAATHFFFSQNYLLAIDEINKFLPSTKVGKYGPLLIDRGRHKNLGMLGACRRVLGLDKDYVSNCDNIIHGKIFLPNDVNYLSNMIPDEMASKLLELQKFEFEYWYSDTGDRLKFSSYMKILQSKQALINNINKTPDEKPK